MYRRILVPLEHSPTDLVILAHVQGLATLCGASVILMHVADGWAARNASQLRLRESEEMQQDRDYLETRCAALRSAGLDVECVLAGGDPATEIVAAAERERCDLIAMGVHGHRGLQDVLYGTTANSVRHRAMMPVLMVRDPAGATRRTPLGSKAVPRA
ncbi:MAG: universal stress protein [Gemmatimonadaceae bacterium]|jgi:nucleotide-binding universal stress UspA family protein|nr:universal stress protein [Gemmatimonadaceae bacterium]